ncbi:sulfate transporter [Apodospora peruviana]|uniref:Sulfate transporter n=1 Tax=Apodospora peruviana TaxID=516989 RepID=A0AAE0II33_9PEZI|nr:sulfate transporter [Apodospora peruviana]
MVLDQLAARLRRVNRYNLQTLRRSPAAEISGALGDLGTLLPVMIALAVQGSINLSSTLVLSGIFNMATGAAFGVPLPVQPMKAIAAASIARKSSLSETVAAGSWVGAVVLVLSITGLLRALTRCVPVPVVKGIQLGAGLRLIISAGSSLILPLGWWTTPTVLDNRLWALGAFLALLGLGGTTDSQKRSGGKIFPYALVTFLIGLCFALVTMDNKNVGGLWRWSITTPSFLSTEAMGMALAQLPLTTLNSVIAASALAIDLFPPPSLPPPSLSTDDACPITPSTTALGISVAAMNLVGCWFGAMPVCHGSGGLAAQHRFGARSGASIVLLGGAKVFLGFLSGTLPLIDLLATFPRSLLGVMVAAAGLELARVGASLNHGAQDLWEEVVTTTSEENDSSDGNTAGAGTKLRRQHRVISDVERDERWTVMLTTAAGILAFRNDSVGFVAGLLCFAAYRFAEYMDGRRQWRWQSQTEESPLLESRGC